MLMNKINIEELHPGEAALSANKVAKFLEALTNGNELAPVSVTNLEGCWGGRDGNNRVRAYAEFGTLNGTSPEIPCEEASFVATQFFAREGLRRRMKYYGRGTQAFLKMPKVSDAMYKNVETEKEREIWDSFGPYEPPYEL
jgi:hypothetical protein